MATPIPPNPPLQQAIPVNSAEPRVSGGSSDVPDRLDPPPGPEKGYVETFFIWIFQWIASFFSPLRNIERERLSHLVRTAFAGEDIFRHFLIHFTLTERNLVYLRLGEAVPLSVPQSLAHRFIYTENYSNKKKICIGRAMVKKDPGLVLAALIRKVNEQLNQN